MSAYIPVELQRQVRAHFRDCCAYCRTAEALTRRNAPLSFVFVRYAVANAPYKRRSLGN
ncbi:MAG: hypothetical protein RIG27_19560 [Coleofasciculus sp. F4-SAH-05]